MKINFKVVCTAVGAVAGAVVGFLIGRHRGRKKGYSEALERYCEVNPESQEEVDDPAINPPVIAEEIKEDPRQITIKITEEEKKLFPFEFNEVEVVDETIDSYRQPSKKKKRPYIIDVGVAGTDGYELKTVHFHKMSNTVTNEDDSEEVVNVKEIIGFDVLNEIDSYEEPITMYVRNEREETDYEVISIDDDWGGGDSE